MTAVSDLKAQLNATDDDADDELMTLLVAAAEAKTTNVTSAATPVTYDAAPADLKLAILMLAAHWFENREASIVGVGIDLVPFGYDDIVASYRKWAF